MSEPGPNGQGIDVDAEDDPSEKEELAAHRNHLAEEHLRSIAEYCQGKSAHATWKWFVSQPGNPPVCVRTVTRIVQTVKDGGTPSLGKAGRKELLSEAEAQELSYAIDAWTRQYKNPISAPEVVSIAKGLLQRNGKGPLLKENGGCWEVSQQWARNFLAKHQFNLLRATTDRTVSNEAVLKAGTVFFRQCENICTLCPSIDRRLTFNMDEFFVLLDSNGRNWTWVRHAPGVPIALKSSKLGFTASVTVNAAGEEGDGGGIVFRLG
jgi:hypothetical protein